MTKVISNTSPLLYLYRIKAIGWLPKLFDEIWTPHAVNMELQAGSSKGYDVPNPDDFDWLFTFMRDEQTQFVKFVGCCFFSQPG